MVNLAKKIVTFLLSLSLSLPLTGYNATKQNCKTSCEANSQATVSCTENACESTPESPTCEQEQPTCTSSDAKKCDSNPCQSTQAACDRTDCSSEDNPAECEESCITESSKADCSKPCKPESSKEECAQTECETKENAPAQTAEAKEEMNAKPNPQYDPDTYFNWITSLIGKRFEKTETAETPEAVISPVSENNTENEILRLVNIEREKVGLNPLRYCTEAQSAANRRAEEIKKSFSHTRPDGRSCFTVFDDFGIQSSYMCAENIACGYASAQAVMDAWMNSPGHKANILSANATALAVGISGNCYVQVFAHDYANTLQN